MSGRVRLLNALLLAFMPTVVSATTIIALRTRNYVLITSDSKAQYWGNPPGSPIVCKIMQTGQVYFAIAGLDHDRLRGVFFQQVIANSLRDSDPFPTKVEKMEQAMRAAVLKEMTTVKDQDPEAYEWIMKDAVYVVSVVLAEYRDGVPCLSGRAFKFVPGGSPSVLVSKCDYYDSSGLCYLGRANGTEGVDNYRDILRTVSDPVQASRLLVEKDIRDFPNDVGPPIISVVLDKDGARWIPSQTECPIAVPSGTLTPRAAQGR